LLDPANILELNDLEEMYAQLAPWIDCIHAKDRKLHVVRGVAAGKGDLDYVKFVTLAARHTPKAPLVLEYVGPNDYKDALAHLRNAMRTAGVKEGT
jgi:sugar phosphate isomerase/epimerase